jgi:hypothetical protein
MDLLEVLCSDEVETDEGVNWCSEASVWIYYVESTVLKVFEEAEARCSEHRITIGP